MPNNWRDEYIKKGSAVDCIRNVMNILGHNYTQATEIEQIEELEPEFVVPSVAFHSVCDDYIKIVVDRSDESTYINFSDGFLTEYEKRAGEKLWNIGDKDIRANATFVSLVEEMGAKANGEGTRLEVVKIPSNSTDWQIVESDGFESVVYVVDGKIHWE